MRGAGWQQGWSRLGTFRACWSIHKKSRFYAKLKRANRRRTANIDLDKNCRSHSHGATNPLENAILLITEFCPGGPRQYMCPYGLEIDISTSFFPHFWQGNSRKSQDLAWEACSVQEQRIKRQQTVSSAGCKVLAPSPGFLLASMPSYCRFRPIECSYSQSVSVSVHHDKIRGSAIL